jgi:hypothetical protein
MASMVASLMMVDAPVETGCLAGPQLRQASRRALSSRNRPPGPDFSRPCIWALALLCVLVYSFALILPPGYNPDPSGRTSHATASWTALQRAEEWSLPPVEESEARMRIDSGVLGVLDCGVLSSDDCIMISLVGSGGGGGGGGSGGGGGGGTAASSSATDEFYCPVSHCCGRNAAGKSGRAGRTMFSGASRFRSMTRHWKSAHESTLGNMHAYMEEPSSGPILR